MAVKLLFQNGLQATLDRYEILQHAELYRGDIALCCLNYTSDRIIAAQAADELLNISGIQASFVFTPMEIRSLSRHVPLERLTYR